MADDLATPASLAPQGQQEPIAQYLYQGLMARGFNAAQASALVGNMKQESEWNPSAPNPKEGGLGLLQWREDRKDALFNFAEVTGRSPVSPDTQMDFIVHEMRGSEAQNAGAFLSAQDIQTANQALHGYIRYGDNTEPVRLQYAQRIAGGNFSSAPVQSGGYGGARGTLTSPGNSLEQPYSPRPPQNFLDAFGNAVADTADKQTQAAQAPAAAAKPQGPLIGQLGAAPLGLQPGRPQQPAPQPVPKPMDYYLALLKQQAAS